MGVRTWSNAKKCKRNLRRLPYEQKADSLSISQLKISVWKTWFLELWLNLNLPRIVKCLKNKAKQIFLKASQLLLALDDCQQISMSKKHTHNPSHNSDQDWCLENLISRTFSGLITYLGILTHNPSHNCKSMFGEIFFQNFGWTYDLPRIVIIF